MNKCTLNDLIKHFISYENIWKNASVLFVSFLPATFTCFGISIKDVLMIFRKNRKAYKYEILGRVWSDNLKNCIEKLGVLYLEIFMLIINMLVIVGVVDIFVLFASIRVEKNTNISSASIFLSIMVGTIIVVAFLGKKRHSKLCSTIIPVVFTFCEGVLFIMLFTLSVRNIDKYLCVLVIIPILFMAALIITLQRCGVYKNYKYLPVLICRAIRHAILISYSWNYFVELQIIQNDIIIWIWMILCYIEYIWIEEKDTTKIAHVTLHTKNGEKITKCKVIQYEENKVGYKLLNGKEEIVDDEEIQMITYQKKMWLLKNYKPKHAGECKLKNGSVFQYQGYQLIRASWVSFFRIKNGIKYAVILKTRDTEKIIEF